MTKHLLSFGARPSNTVLDLQFNLAVTNGIIELISLLLDHGAMPGEIARRGPGASNDPVVQAVAYGQWEGLELLMKRSPIDPIHLFNLVQTYMYEEMPALSVEAFEKGVLCLLEADVGGGVRCCYSYNTRRPDTFDRQRFLYQRSDEYVTEGLSMKELVGKTYNRNNRDRARVLHLLGVE